MSTPELRKRLIDKIQKTENENLLQEASRLLNIETEDLEVYKLNSNQQQAIQEARDQIKNGQFLTDQEATNEIDGWLK